MIKEIVRYVFGKVSKLRPHSNTSCFIWPKNELADIFLFLSGGLLSVWRSRSWGRGDIWQFWWTINDLKTRSKAVQKKAYLSHKVRSCSDRAFRNEVKKPIDNVRLWEQPKLGHGAKRSYKQRWALVSLVGSSYQAANGTKQFVCQEKYNQKRIKLSQVRGTSIGRAENAALTSCRLIVSSW